MFIIYVRDYGSSFRFQRKCCLKYEPLAYIMVRIANSSIRFVGLDTLEYHVMKHIIVNNHKVVQSKYGFQSTRTINNLIN